uniref:Uncharacterized protein n=1 Tax=Arundo donax TaxID=35708 RepID=A0A0A8XZ70_ARUDO
MLWSSFYLFLQVRLLSKFCKAGIFMRFLLVN